MRIEQLEAVIKVADECSMHRAADEMHTSVQNVSQLISQLEKQLDVKIFVRNNYGAFLTSEGELLYAEARKVISSVDVIRDSFGKKHVGRKLDSIRELSIVASYACEDLARDVMDDLDTTRGVERGSIILRDAAEVNHAFFEGVYDNPNFDLALTNMNEEEFANGKPHFKKYRAYEISKFGLAVMISAADKLASRESLQIKDLTNKPFISNQSSRDFESHVMRALENRGVFLKPSFVFNSGELLEHYVARNKGFSVRPYTDTAKNAKISNKLALIPLKDRINFYQVALFSSSVEKGLVEEIVPSLEKSSSFFMRLY